MKERYVITAVSTNAASFVLGVHTAVETSAVLLGCVRFPRHNLNWAARALCNHSLFQRLRLSTHNNLP